MAVVSRPLYDSRRTVQARVRHWMASGSMTALACGLLLVLGYLLLSPLMQWSQRRLDDARYGTPRTTQLDGFVGHAETSGDPTHLIALNLRGQISIMEFPGGDPAQVKAISGPYLVGADGAEAVPLLALQDVNGDGAQDLLLQVRAEVVVYVNDNGGFRLMTPAERAKLAPAEARGR